MAYKCYPESARQQMELMAAEASLLQRECSRLLQRARLDGHAAGARLKKRLGVMEDTIQAQSHLCSHVPHEGMDRQWSGALPKPQVHMTNVLDPRQA